MDASTLRATLLLANDFKEGDLPLGGTRDDRVRAEARRALAALRLGDIRRTRLVDDGVSEALARSRDPQHDADLDALTVGDVARILLAPGAEAWIRRHREGLTSEAIAAVAKILSSGELSRIARAIANPLPGTGVTIGAAGHFGSRIQPNSPGDDEDEILLSILEGLSYGCGDVVLGLNPASDDLDTIVELEDLLHRVVDRLQLPTRFCVLSDLVKQHRAAARTRVDVAFQSLAGTSRALGGMVGLDVDGLLDLARGFDGLYFETGQGSAVTNGTAEGVDMVTLEARAHGVARYLRRATGAWTIVNDVAGFIGPEVFRSEAQLERACLEDVVMGKLHGLTMGLDVCSTFHMGIAPGALRALTARIVEEAAPAYLMAVAGNADPMLGYLTTSFREHPVLRRRTGRQATSAMERRLGELGVRGTAGLTTGEGSPAALYAAWARGGGERRSLAALEAEGRRKVDALRQKGFDVGHGAAADGAAPPEVLRRLDAIFADARRALYATLDAGAVGAACPRARQVRTRARDRDDFLAHPVHGERLSDDDAGRLARAPRGRQPDVQIVVSDGLNADAINAHLRALVPPLRQALSRAGVHAADSDVVVVNGRVRAGYHVGALLDPLIVVHLIGERPGTGLDTASAYLTYGRDVEGGPRWNPDLDHAYTSAVCGIHPRAKTPEAAVSEMVGLIGRMLERRCSGVALGGAAPRRQG